MTDDFAEQVTALVALGLMGRMWARRPFQRHRLDLRFEGPKNPYLMIGHIFNAAMGAPVDGRWFRVGLVNKSAVRIDNVSVQLVSVDPPDIVHAVPLPLHLMHDNPPPGEPNLRTFSVEPSGDTPSQFVDVVSKVIGSAAIQIEHTVPAVQKLVPAMPYTFVLRISAPFQKSQTRGFVVGLDNQGELTFSTA